MPRSGGTYTPPSNSWNPAVDETAIDPDDWGETLDDLAEALTGSVAKDGQTATTAVIPFALGITVPAGSAAAPSVSKIGDTNTGLFFPAADIMGLTVGGNEKVRFASTDTTFQDNVLFTGTFDAYVRLGATRIWRPGTGVGAAHPKYLSGSDPGSADAGEHLGTIAKSLISNGYWRSASGLIIQWNSDTSSTSGETTWTYPLEFPTSARAILGSVRSSSAPGVVRFDNKSLTSVQFSVFSTDHTTRIARVVDMVVIGS